MAVSMVMLVGAVSRRTRVVVLCGKTPRIV